jgi:ATP-binding cassette subfamily C protein LapB
MDAQSELLFLRQLKEAIGTCTLVVVTHRPAVLELVERVIVLDSGRIVMDGPKQAVLAALSGSKPAPAQALPGQAPPLQTVGNVHRHPSTQPVQRDAAV